MNDIEKKFSDTQNAAQQYVLGQMSELDAQEFEAYFLSRHDVLELVEVTQKLHFGLKENKAVNAQANSQDRNSVFDRILAWLTIPVPAFAVLAIAALLSPLMFNSLSSNSNHDINLASNVKLINFSTTATRSSDVPRATINLSGIGANAALLIKVKSVKHKEYKLKLLSDQTDKAVWESAPFQVSALRDHLVMIPKLTASGDLGLEVVGINNDASETPIEFCHYSEVCH